VSLAALLNRPCTITHRTASKKRDAYGNEIPVTANTDTVCEVQESSRSVGGVRGEPAQGGEVADAGWIGFFPAGTVITTADSVSVGGIGSFSVVGEPWPARNPRTQQVNHVEVPLRRTVGGEEGS
jgi:hypothetical protein